MSGEANPEEFKETPSDQALRWQVELAAATERLKPFHEMADEAVARFLDERESGSTKEKRLNLYSSGIQTKLAMLYGNTPDVSVERRFADAKDDAGRVAAEMLERVLNSDLERTGDNFQTAQALAGLDNQTAGLGGVWLRYEVETEQVEATPAIQDEATGQEIAPAIEAHEKKTWEDVATDWVYWKDFRWSPCRVWHEARWVARKSEMPTKQRNARFSNLTPEQLAGLPTKSSKPKEDGERKPDPLEVTEVWEIWEKATKKVYWYVEGAGFILDTKDDPLGLEGFFPCPEPMMANLATGKLVPRPDWILYRDQYLEIDALTFRMSLLRQAIRATGLYDAASPEMKQLLEGNTGENKLYPSTGWAEFLSKGAFAGAMQLMPLGELVAAYQALQQARAEIIQDVFQASGMSDIMRGQASTTGVTATEQSIKARFGSVRMQAQQDRAAKFATDTQRIRAEIICKWFDPQTIVERCNCEMTEDAPLVPQALELLKGKFPSFRIAVKSESMSLTDFAQLKQERMELLAGVGSYLQVAAGAVQQFGPQSAPGLFKILQATVAGLKGADAVESTLDQIIAQAEQALQQAAANPQQTPPDPKLEAEKLKLQGQAMKGQADMAKEQFKHQASMEQIAAEVQADAQREENQATWNVREAAQKQIVTNALKPKEPPKAAKT